jgi:hypothetical protein
MTALRAGYYRHSREKMVPRSMPGDRALGAFFSIVKMIMRGMLVPSPEGSARRRRGSLKNAGRLKKIDLQVFIV